MSEESYTARAARICKAILDEDYELATELATELAWDYPNVKEWKEVIDELNNRDLPF